MSKDKYDRQTRLWGEGQILICAAKLLCLNSDSCTSEILKNLILSGVGEVTIVDDRKISSEDLKNNFFVDAGDVGKVRGEIVLKNLLELNPDVKGNFINKNSKDYLDDEKSDFKSFDILIATNLLAEENNKLYSLAKKYNLRLVIVKNNGLINCMRLYENYHGNMNLRLLDNPPADYRLSCPWKELIDFANSFDLEKMDIIDHKNVPYFIIMIQALEKYRKNKNDPKANPKTKEDKEEYKSIVKSFMLSTGAVGENDNIDESISKLYYVNDEKNNLTTPKMEYIFEVLEKTPQKEIFTKSNKYMKLFFLYFIALKKYFEKNKTYPLCGNIPDMISNTANFIALKQIYNTKAKNDHKEMRDMINAEIKENVNLSDEDKKELDKLVNNLTSDQIDIVDILNKNWPQVSLFVYPNNDYETEGKSLEIDLDENFQKLNFVWYLLFRASDKFMEKNNRYPGQNVDDFKKDVPELFGLLKEEYNKLTIKPDLGNLLNEDNAFEFCRMGQGFVPPVVSIIGSIASQEIIKLITYQFETVNNTVIYDGINVTLNRFKI
jgi:amyloid beta precursor protein binding protein 1